MMMALVAITGIEYSSKIPYSTKNAQPMVLTIRRRLMSFIKKDSKIPSDPM